MGLEHIIINNELSPRTRALISTSSFSELRNYLLSRSPLKTIIEEINQLIDQEYLRDKTRFLEILTDEAYALQIANDENDFHQDSIEEKNDKALFISYGEESTNLENQRNYLKKEILQGNSQLDMIERKIMQFNHISYNTQAITIHTHGHPNVHTHENPNHSVSIHHRTQSHSQHSSQVHLMGTQTWSHINEMTGLQNEYSIQKGFIIESEQKLNDVNKRLAKLEDLKRELPQRLNIRKIKQHERINRALIREHNNKSPEQLSQKNKYDLEIKMKQQIHSLDEQLQDLKRELWRKSYPCYLESLNNLLLSGELNHMKLEERGPLTKILKYMQVYSSKQNELERLSLSYDSQVRELENIKRSQKGNTAKILSNSNTEENLHKQNRFLMQEDNRLNHLLDRTTQKRNTALFCSLGGGISTAASAAAITLLVMNPIVFIVPGILLLATIGSFLFAATVHRVQKSNLEYDINTNNTSRKRNDLTIKGLKTHSQELLNSNLSLKRNISEREQEISNKKNELSALESSLKVLLQNAESVGEMPKFSIQRGIFDAQEPSAPCITELDELKVTPY